MSKLQSFHHFFCNKVPDHGFGEFAAIRHDLFDGIGRKFVAFFHRFFGHPLSQLFSLPRLHPFPDQTAFGGELCLQAGGEKLQAGD